MTDLPVRAPCEHGRYELHRLGVIGTPDRTVCRPRKLSTEELVEIVGAAAIAEGIAEVLFDQGEQA